MGYLDIDNLYKNPDVLRFKEVYALEKIHGTSAHVAFKDGALEFFSGGSSHKHFVALFDQPALLAAFAAVGQPGVVVFGEAYGGKLQGMKHVYGDRLRFVAFDVKSGNSWLSVPQAAEVAAALSLEFVAYDLIPGTIEAVDAHRALPSVQAVRNGMGDGHQREGDVLRSPIEVWKNNGGRIIAKHKNVEFSEMKTPRVVDPEKMAVLDAADAIAEEWVTPMRLTHVIDHLRAVGIQCDGMDATGHIVKEMIADVKKESGGEVVWTKDAEKAIGKKAAGLFKRLVTTVKV